MSATTNSKNIRTNILIFFLFLALFSSFSSMNSRTQSLEQFKLDLEAKINNYPLLKSGSNLDPDSMQGLLLLMIDLSQQPQSDEQTKTFSMIIEKVRKLIDEMFKEQKDSDVIFKKNSEILIKYHIRSKNSIPIAQDKYELNRRLIELLKNIKSTNGSIDIKVNFEEIIESLKVFKDYLSKLQEKETKFDKISSKYFDDVQNQILNISMKFSKNNTNRWENMLHTVKNQIEKLPWVQATAIKNAFIMAINTDKEILLIRQYSSIFSNQQNLASGTVKKIIFESIDEKIKNAENESNNLSVKIKNEMELGSTSRNSLNSIFDEYVKNTEKRSEIINTILKVLDFMNMRIKKVSVKFMVYLENAKDGFKEYVNSYEFVNVKKYIFQNIITDEDGKKLVDQFNNNKL